MKPICKECEHYHVNATQNKRNQWRYQHRCLHQNAKGKECNYGALGESKGFDTRRKTSPRWCPLRIAQPIKEYGSIMDLEQEFAAGWKPGHRPIKRNQSQIEIRW